MAEDAQAPASTQAPVDKTPVYEVGFHIVPTVGEEGIGAVVEKVRKMLGGAEIIAEGHPVKMPLAYTIERATQGKHEKYSESYFGWVKFAMPAEDVPAVAEKLRGIRDVLRFILVTTVREDTMTQPRRAVFTSDRLEGETITAPKREAEKGGEVSEADLEKSIEALTG